MSSAEKEKINMMEVSFMAVVTKEELSRALTFYTLSGIAVALVAAILAAICGFKILKLRTAIGVMDSAEKRSLSDEVKSTKTDLADTKAKADVLEVALREARSAVAQRTISPEQREKFIASVKGVQRGKVQIWTIANDPECWEYAVQVQAMIKAAGYDVHPMIQTRMQFGGAIVGCWLLVKDMDRPAPHGGDIQAGLKDIGIEAGGNAEPMVDDEQTAVVVIGSKKPL